MTALPRKTKLVLAHLRMKGVISLIPHGFIYLPVQDLKDVVDIKLTFKSSFLSLTYKRQKLKFSAQFSIQK